MIISLDGNTYLGKTSIIEQWNTEFSNSIICEEYDTDLGELEGKTHFQKQQYYFELEAKRLGCIRKESIVFLDRSCLSMLAHSYAVSLMENKNLLIETLGILEKQREKNLIVCPQAVVFFVQLEKQRVYTDINRKGGEEILYDALYREYIDLFYKKIIMVLPEEYIDYIYVCSKDKREEWDDLAQWVCGHCCQETNREKEELFDVLLSAIKQICNEIGINDDK